jgi:Ni/Fe-hydrogenase subunit HybB-like protein
MKIAFREIEARGRAGGVLLGALVLVAMLGLVAAHYMEEHGHIVTGMSNHIVWGMPHVFAVFLIVAASGALNVASIASVFGKAIYKPLAPLSGLLAIALLIGGLTVLMLDLGRPDRLVVAMTQYNFKSIFAWNVFLYTGFLAIVAVYLWAMMERRFNAWSQPLGFTAFIWRLLLTTGTGSIFGFLVARQAYDSALLAPMFVVMSFAYGLAVYLLVLTATFQWSARPLSVAVLLRLKGLLAVFVASALYFVAVYHLTNLYFTKHHGVERFILLEGGIHTALFWIGQVLIGACVPLALLLHPRLGRTRRWIVVAAALVVVGGFAQMYVTIIGGQAYPLVLFPGMLTSSTFQDGAIHGYQPSAPELLLGLGGVAVAGLIVALGVRFLRFVPERLDDRMVESIESPPPAAALHETAA